MSDKTIELVQLADLLDEQIKFCSTLHDGIGVRINTEAAKQILEILRSLQAGAGSPVAYGAVKDGRIIELSLPKYYHAGMDSLWLADGLTFVSLYTHPPLSRPLRSRMEGDDPYDPAVPRHKWDGDECVSCGVHRVVCEPSCALTVSRMEAKCKTDRCTRVVEGEEYCVICLKEQGRDYQGPSDLGEP